MVKYKRPLFDCDFVSAQRLGYSVGKVRFVCGTKEERIYSLAKESKAYRITISFDLDALASG